MAEQVYTVRSTTSLAKSCGPKFLNCPAVSLPVLTWRNSARP
jgi:hypothetical protein